jgi:hypothetical protein
MNVMAPTMQVACKAFIVPNPAARSPKERYTHVPRSLRRVRHARCFSGQCPSEATNKIGMRHIYWSCCQNATATQGGWLHHQKKVVEKLAQAGHGTNIAKPVLQAMESGLDAFEEHRETIVETMKNPGGCKNGPAWRSRPR